jgi:hypothetical protein
MSMDELLDYIETDNKGLNKAKNKKNKKNEKGESDVNNYNSGKLENKTEKEIDHEITNFKNRIMLDSIQFRNIVKMKAIFSEDWILSL